MNEESCAEQVGNFLQILSDLYMLRFSFIPGSSLIFLRFCGYGNVW